MSNTPAIPAGNVPAVPTRPTGLPDGLEDIEVTDLTMPIFRMDKDTGCFVNGLTGEQFSEFPAIILGVKKQRILWPREPGGPGEPPMCRSYDFKTGFPRLEAWSQKQPKGGPSALAASGFTQGEVERAAGTEVPGLNCDSCALKEWGEDRTPPWCNEQWTMPFIRLDENGDELGLSVISFQRTGIKPCRSYVSGFAQAKSPLYTVVTKIKAVKAQKSSVSWVVPSFQRLRETDSMTWAERSLQWAEVGAYLSTPRTFGTDPDEEEVAEATVQTTSVSRPHAPEARVPEPTPPSASAPEPPIEAQVVAEQEPAPVPRAQPAAAFDPDEEPF